MEGEDDEGMGRRRAEEFLELRAARALLSRTRAQCFLIRQGSWVLSRTPRDCVIVSEGGGEGVGTGSNALSLDSNTSVPSPGAALFNVTVQVARRCHLGHIHACCREYSQSSMYLSDRGAHGDTHGDYHDRNAAVAVPTIPTTSAHTHQVSLVVVVVRDLHLAHSVEWVQRVRRFRHQSIWR